MWINALDLEDEILLTGFENLQFIEVHQFLFGSWITPILLLTQFRACKHCEAEMYPGFQIMGSSGPLLEKFGGPLLSFGGPANL